MKILLTQRQGLTAEAPFIETHKKYADLHGYEHKIVQERFFPKNISSQYKNIYKYAKPFYILDILNNNDVEELLFIESDFLILNFDYKWPEGDFVSNSCMDIDGIETPCPCIMRIKNTAENRAMFNDMIQTLKEGIADTYPYDEFLFNIAVRKNKDIKWTYDHELCGYHKGISKSANADYSGIELGVHVSGVSWEVRTAVLPEYYSDNHRIGVMVVCKDRTENLLKVLPDWAAHPKISEVVIVDYGSQPKILKQNLLLPPESLEKIKIVRFEPEDKKSFNLGKACNIGLYNMDSGIVIKIDCDYKMKNDLFLQESKLLGKFICGNYLINKDKYLNGFLMARRQYLLNIGGYREDFVGWGFEDDDLYNRLLNSGIMRENAKILDYSISHIPHDDSQRTKYYSEKNVTKTYHQNIYRSFFPLRKQKAEYTVEKTTDGHFLAKEKGRKDLIPFSKYVDFKDVFSKYVGKRALVFYDFSTFEPEDYMILEATIQLLDFYEITVVPNVAEADVVMFSGGNSMGDVTTDKKAKLKEMRRNFLQMAKQNNKPTIILPQSFSGFDDTVANADIVYVTNEKSKKFCKRAILMPPLSSCMNGWIYSPSNPKTGKISNAWDFLQAVDSGQLSVSNDEIAIAMKLLNKDTKG